MKQQELYEQIEAYLNNALPPEQMQAWEQRLAEDASLRQEVALHQQLQKDYDTGRLQLRANLRDIMQEPLPPDLPSASGGRYRWARWLGIVGLVVIFIWYILQWQEPVRIAPVPVPIDVPPAPPDSLPASPKEPQPIAMTDLARFKPNPGMEAFVKGTVRSESLEIKLSHPANGARFVPDAKGVVTVRFKGSVSMEEGQQLTKFVLSFFDNQNSNKPLLDVPVSMQKDTSDLLIFDVQQRLKFPLGLYYFTLEEADKGEVLYAGKFLIGR